MGVNNTTLLANLDQNAVITKYSRKLRRKAVAKDIYTNIRGDDLIYQGKAVSVPDMFYHKVEAEATSGANNARIIMKDVVNANILRGRTTALGTEIPPVIKDSQIWRQNYRIVFQDEPGYGEDKLDAMPYRLYQEHVNDLYPHASAEEGLEIRMAAIEGYGWNLMAGSTVNNCVAHWNPNFYILGLSNAQQPVYHPNAATYTNRIVNGINIASGGNGQFTQTAGQMLSGNGIDSMLRWAFGRRMKPMMVDGWSTFVLTVSHLGAQRFSDPAFTDSMGSRWVQAGQVTNKTIQNWYGVLGMYNGPYAKVVIAIDDRLPTLLPTGTAAPFGLSANYVWPTDSDLRLLDNTLVRDAMILHGKGGLVKWEPEAMHLIQQDWDYNLRNGKGYAGVRGIQRLEFNNAQLDPTNTGSQFEHWGSAVIVGGRAEP